MEAAIPATPLLVLSVQLLFGECAEKQAGRGLLFSLRLTTCASARSVVPLRATRTLATLRFPVCVCRAFYGIYALIYARADILPYSRTDERKVSCAVSRNVACISLRALLPACPFQIFVILRPLCVVHILLRCAPSHMTSARLSIQHSLYAHPLGSELDRRFPSVTRLVLLTPPLALVRRVSRLLPQYLGSCTIMSRPALHVIPVSRDMLPDTSWSHPDILPRCSSVKPPYFGPSRATHNPIIFGLY